MGFGVWVQEVRSGKVGSKCFSGFLEEPHSTFHKNSTANEKKGPVLALEDFLHVVT